MSIIRATEYIDLFIKGEFAQARRHPSQQMCPLCHGIGFLMGRTEDGYDLSSPCRCRGLDLRIRTFNQAEIPARYVDARFENYTPQSLSAREALLIAERFAWAFTPQEKGLLFYGGYGTGKTYLTICIIRTLSLLRGYPVRFIEFSHLLATLKSHFNSQAGELLMQRLVETECLVIDELGEGRLTDWSIGVLEELITRRYNASGTTIFTTNYDPRTLHKHQSKHLEERIGARSYSRLQQMCMPIPVFGADYRTEGDLDHLSTP